MVLLCDSQVLRARNRGESCGISPVVVGHPNYVSNLGLFGGVFQSFPIHILSYFEYINMIKYGSIEYIIQFISICLSYFDVSHFEIWTESEYIYILYTYIYIYVLKDSKKVVRFPIFNGWRSRNIWITETLSFAYFSTPVELLNGSDHVRRWDM